MTKIAAFHWTSEADVLSFMVVDGDTYGVLNAATKEQKVRSEATVRKFVDDFIAVLKRHHEGGIVEHHIAIEGTDPPPSKFSKYIKKHLKERLEQTPGWEMAESSVQGMTTEDDREKLQAGLVDLQLWGGIHGTTYEIDLWTIAVHHRDPKKCLKVLWKADQNNFRRWSKEKTKQYNDWYEALAV